MNQRNMRLCLCRSCVGAFFESNKYRIFRAKPLEVIKEPCDLCRVRLGYDFVIKPQKHFIPYPAQPASADNSAVSTPLPN